MAERRYKATMFREKVFVMTSINVFCLLLTLSGVSGFGTSCSFRCQQTPTLLDHMYPRGCFCHATCGGKLPCCRDKAKLCGSSFGGGGKQDCMLPRKVRQATIVGGEKLFYTRGEAIKYECPFHYEIKGSATRTCRGNNIWSPGPPRCNYVVLICRPPRIRDGDYSTKKKHYTSGDTIQITCNSGYVIRGKSSLRCFSNTWDSFTPSCIRDRCATITHCSDDATCRNLQFYANCICNDGFDGDGWICKRIPCYMHTCKTNEMCMDNGDESGEYTCKCKEGYVRDETTCKADPCFDNNCHENATCSATDETDYVCTCKDGFSGNGKSCEGISCYKHTCKTNEMCLDNGDESGDYTCKCKEGYVRDGETCKADPCFDSNCHENATCIATNETDYLCSCKDGLFGNGTSCRECSPSAVSGQDVSGPCSILCEEICCDSMKLRECRICIHMQCNGGEVCGEDGLSKVPTVCTESKCYENEGGFTVETPDYVHCLDEQGVWKENMNCCWIGE